MKRILSLWFVLLPSLLIAQNWQWVRGFGGTATDRGYQIAHHGDRVYVAGNFRGSINLGGTVLISQGQEDVFVMAVDTSAAAQVIWARRLGGPGQDGVFGMTVDPAGNLLLTGRFIDQCQFSPTLTLTNPIAGQAAVYTAKYQASGALIWARNIAISSSFNTDATGVRVLSDPQGNAYMLCTRNSSFGPAVLQAGGLSLTAEFLSFVIKYDASGAEQWVAPLPVGNFDTLGAFQDLYEGTDLVRLPTGTIRVLSINTGMQGTGGSTFPQISIANSLFSTPRGRSLWLDYNGNNGQFQDSIFIAQGRFVPYALRRGSGGDFFVAGNSYGSFTLSNDQVIQAPAFSRGVVLSRWTPGGQPQWVRLASGGQEARALELDSNDGAYVSGFYNNEFTFNATSIQQTGDNLFVLKADAQGNLEWLTGADNSQARYGTALTLDASGDAYVTGFFAGNAAFPIDTLSSNGGDDILVGKLGCAPIVPSLITGDTLRCPGTATYTVPSAGPAYGYQWSLSGGGTLSASGNQATVTWTGPGAHTLSVALTNACGQGASRSLAVTIRDVPALPYISGDSLACLGQRTYLVSSQPGESYQWSLSGGGIGFASGNSFLVNWIALGNQQITVTPSNLCGAGPAATFDVLVQGIPAQPAPINGNSAICLSTQTYSVPAQSGTNYQWTLSSGGTLLSSGNSATVNWTTAGQHTLSVIPSTPCGIGSARVLTINVAQSPGLPAAITGNQQVCPGPQSYSVNTEPGVSYTWNLAGGGALSPSFNSADVQWTVPGTYTLSVTPGNQCGSGPPRVATITVVAVPGQPGPIIGLDTVCQGNQVYALSAQPGLSYAWTLSGGGILSPNLNTAAVAWTAGGTYTLSATPGNQCGSGPPRSLTVFVRDSSAQVNQITGDANVCQTLENYTVPDLPGLSYVWSLSGGGILNAIDTAAFVTWQTPGLYILSVQTSDGCANALPVQVNAPPNVPDFVSAPDSVCLNSQTYSVLPLPNLNYQWSLSGGGLLSSGGPNAVVEWTQTGNYLLEVSASNLCGPGGTAAVNVDVSDVPSALGLITGADSACLDTARYAVISQSGVDYQWLLPGGGLLFAQSDSASVLWQSPGLYPLAVRALNGCGAGPVSTLHVAVVTPPVVPGIQGETQVCLGSQTYRSAAIEGVSYQWSLSGGGNLTPLGDSAVIDWATPGVYTLELLPANRCGNGPLRSLTIEVLDIPVQPAPIVGSEDVCPGLQSYSVPTGSPISTYQWNLSGGGSLVSLLNTATVNWTQPGVYTLTVSPQNLCGVGPGRSLSTTVRPEPLQPASIVGEAVPCLGNEPYSVPLQNGVNYLWSLSSGGELTQNGNQASVSWANAGIHTLRVQTQNQCGISAPRLLNVEVRNLPDSLIFLVGDSLVCVGNAVLYRSNLAEGAAYRWSLNGGGSLDTLTNQSIVNWTTPGSYLLSVRAENTCGNGPVSTLAVVVADAPAQPVSIDGVEETCLETRTYFAPVLAGVGYQWDFSGGGSLVGAGASVQVQWRTPGLHVLTLTPRNRCGDGPERSLVVQVNDVPLPPGLDLRGDTLTAITDEPVLWFLDNIPLPDSLPNPLIGPEPGMYTAQARNECGLSRVSLPQVVNETSGPPFRVFVYPNPSSGPVTVEFPPYLGWRSIRVMDIRGRELGRYLNLGQQKVELDFSQLAQGIYTLELDTELLRITKKLILQR